MKTDLNDPAAWAQADTVLLNGRILTADAAFSIAEAVAIREGRFMAVGSNAEVKAFVGATTEVTDLGGRTVVPGLIDTHAHVEAAGLFNYTVSFDGVTTVAEALARVKDMAARTAPGEWIRGRMWHPVAQMKEKRFLHRWELDDVAPDHPVCLPVGHFTLTNSLALKLAGIDRDTPDPAGGEIHRDKASGEPNGVLEEAAEDLVQKLLPPWSQEVRVQQIRDAMAYFNSFGITSAISARVNPEDMRVHQIIAGNGDATLRISAMFAPTGGLNPTLSVEDWQSFLGMMGTASDFGDDWLSYSGLKMQIDGGMTLRTADMRESYPDQPGYHGTVVVGQERLNELVAIANRLGWRVGAHAVGDAAIDKLLDAYEHADREKSIRDRRFIVIHGSLMQPDQMRRARALGVRVDTQSVFLWDKAATIANYLGEETAARAIPLRWMIDEMGLDAVAQGTDFPINTLNPFINMYIMVTRKDINGNVYGADQRVTREEALRLYTSAAARYSFSEHKSGTIEVGKLADLAVLSGDPLTVPEEDLKAIVALRTIVGGRTVFTRAG
ncbi:MAG TPA: amidohydrolase [Xanthobacteraceae bacterium]|nr:amidohydrolase [Xanthobacteraceae bacterium]